MLGPLFINDLAFFTQSIIAKLFEDDTIWIDTMDILITKDEILFNWCKFKKLGINWPESDFSPVNELKLLKR